MTDKRMVEQHHEPFDGIRQSCHRFDDHFSQMAKMVVIGSGEAGIKQREQGK